jgi:hypothetical protein
MFTHLRLRRKLGLLAAGVLEGRERDQVREHLSVCARCRAEHQELRLVVSALESDPLRETAASPPLPLAIMLDRVERELDRPRPAPQARPHGWLVALPAAAALVAALVIVPRLLERTGSVSEPASAAIPEPEPPRPPELSEDALDRLERNLAREHAASYLNEAGELLVSVAATGLDCDRRLDQLDVGEAPERSRELLERQRLVVEAGGEAVASAQGVLDDVELALREVAELPSSCVKRRDIERLRQQVERRQLLMRIRLMTRELEG